MKHVTVAVPVIRVRYEVDVTQRSRLLPLDTLVLAAVDEGKTCPDAIGEYLRLVPRLIDTSIVQLMDEELLLLNVQTGELALTDRARAAFKDNKVMDLAYRGEQDVLLFHLAQELSWGGIVPLGPQLGRVQFGKIPDEAIALPRCDPTESVLNLPGTRIAGLFNAHRSLTRQKKDRRLVALNGRRVEHAASSYLLLDFALYQHQGDVDLWPVTGADGSNDTSAMRALIARVRRWLHERPEHWRSFTSETAKADVAPRIFVPFTHFAPFAEWTALQSTLVDDHTTDVRMERARADCTRFQSARVPLLVVRDAEHIAHCRRLIADATKFCVIHSAFWSEHGIAQYADVIEAALRRGVNVYLLCGLEDERHVNGRPPIIDRLLDESSTLEGLLVVSEVQHRSHAKFVVSDGRAAVVSSFNFLSATSENPQLNVGLCAGAGHDLDDSLGWSILRDLVEHVLPGDAADHLEQQLGEVELALSTDTDDLNRTTLAAEAYAGFKDWFDSLGGTLDAPAAWETVTNDSHRDALLVALYSAERSVTITSGDLTRSAADAVLEGYIRAAVGRGVRVRLLWGSQKDDAVERANAVARAAELQNALGSEGRFSINLEAKPIHAKLLIVDDWVSIVSSFNFLSY